MLKSGSFLYHGVEKGVFPAEPINIEVHTLTYWVPLSRREYGMIYDNYIPEI